MSNSPFSAATSQEPVRPDGDAPIRAAAAGVGQTSAAPPKPVTLRALAIACALMPLLALWVIKVEMVLVTAWPTVTSLFYHVTFTVLVLALANKAVARRRPEWALSGAEILTIYMMLSIAATFCSTDMLQILIPLISFPYYNANPQNNWNNLILRYLKPWAMLTDPRALSAVAVGNASIYSLPMLSAWARPVGFWLAFLLVLMMALLTLNLFFRQQWTERERLSYPIIYIPMVIATGLGDLLRSRLFWIAFAITGGIDLNNNFSFLFPSIPTIPIHHAFEFRNYFVEPPWNAIAPTFINLTPLIVGLMFFVPTDLAFSCWFFFVLYKLELVAMAAIGVREIPGFPFPDQQGAGGYLALGLMAIWVSRRHLAAVARTILGRPGGADDSREPLTYRGALLLFALCFAVLVGMGSALGARPWLLVVFFTIFFIYALAITRMRAELGPASHDLHHAGPDVLLHDALGTHQLTKGDLSTFSLFYWFNRAYRSHISPHSMEGFKIAQILRITSRSMWGAMILAVVVGAVAALWAVLHMMNVYGYSNRVDWAAMESWNQMVSVVVMPQRPRLAASAATIFGLVFALVMGALRMRFTWWIWHPVGYAISMSWAMENTWFCLFMAWLIKTLITRYGGAPAYRRAVPFFVGMVLGQFVVGSLWSIWAAFTDHPVYVFWGH
ncbi:MAG: hypothetical protein M1457_14415 [bacterium]|nr:hypothetical protein [bacterium]